MRLWSIHPKYLDRIGLIALWREALLAQKVLKKETKGYRHHPQLRRFLGDEQAIGAYLLEIWNESTKRGYNFDRRKIAVSAMVGNIPVTRGQINYEFELLCRKLKIRDIEKYKELRSVKDVECHPIFKVIKGEVETWEKHT